MIFTKLTKQGQQLLARCIGDGVELKFVRFALGDGFLSEGERILDLTDLKSWQMNLPIVSCKSLGNGSAQITGNLNNCELVRGFAAREHGLFATDPDTGEEILFSYRNLGDEYDFVVAANQDIVKNVFLSEVVEIRDAENVTAVLDLSVAYINTQDFQKHLDDPHPHLNAPCHYDDVETASEIWATDSDNHLHKISVENLRELVSDKTEKLSTQDIISAAQNELGLASNILMIEDFTDEIVTDYFKSKVSSYAEHGALLGIENPQNLRTGGKYILSDGVFAEEVETAAVLKNLSGYYARLAAPVANTYITANLYLYRSTPPPCNKIEINWNGAEFGGVRANITRTVELENYFLIQGNGFFYGEFFTLG